MKKLIAMVLIGAFALAACASGDEGTDFAVDEVGGAFQDSGGEAEEPASGDGGTVDVDLPSTEDRQVIRQARIEIHAADTRSAYEEVQAIAARLGGFTASAVVHPASEDQEPAVDVTIRIPSTSLDDALSAIKDIADEVVTETQDAKDVTEQFVDLEARLTNLEALEVELRALLQEVRAREDADPDEILRVFNEVSNVRGQIEQLQGQINYLSDLTALSTIEVRVTQTPSTAPIVDEPWSPATVARDALSELVNGLQSVADFAITFVIYTLPMLLIVLGPLALVAVLVYRKWLRKPTPPAPSPDLSTPEA